MRRLGGPAASFEGETLRAGTLGRQTDVAMMEATDEYFGYTQECLKQGIDKDTAKLFEGAASAVRSPAALLVLGSPGSQWLR